jgi:hypothetical protein
MDTNLRCTCCLRASMCVAATVALLCRNQSSHCWQSQLSALSHEAAAAKEQTDR